MEERIQYLFKRYRDNTCTRQEYEEFFALLRQSAHDGAVRELIRQAYEAEAGNAPADAYVDENGQLVVPFKRNRAILRKALALAAIFVAAAGAALWLMPRQKSVQPTHMARQHTARNEYKRIVLPDSSEVWLNAASTLEFPEDFGKRSREVYLTGEAYFDVRHAVETPFIIHTGKVSTTVLGTAFNIRAYPGRKSVVVSVSKGKVSVNYGEGAPAMLTNGQQLKVDVTRPAQSVKKLLVADAAPWKQGNLQYDGERLADIMADLERVYDVKITIMQENLRELTVSTSFRRNIGVEQALQVLCKLTDTRLSLAEGVYTIH
ncbi:FecR domain-containing protein [Chitinophaga sp. YIM B06452]|uniref:FecR family protein n=1 Tax=Chitinophaga sp. YIM B06452 TaxID=3082158 RepID=UPI0031FF250D